MEFMMVSVTFGLGVCRGLRDRCCCTSCRAAFKGVRWRSDFFLKKNFNLNFFLLLAARFSVAILGVTMAAVTQVGGLCD